MTRVRTRSGTVRGAVVDGVHLFRGIPYAAPPFGPRRYAAPVAPEPWSGVREATTAGVAPPQPSPSPQDSWAPLYAPSRTGEDCLTLDVATPEPGSAALPVVVHIHGGGYVTGAGSLPLFSGVPWARSGVVHVSINYRLGLEGFLHLEDAPDNLGLRDQVAALTWVREDVAAFGGDPDRVTVMGQSGGGVSVLTQLALPASADLLHRGIAMSGSTIASIDPDAAAGQTRAVARLLRVPATVEGFRGVSVDRTVAAAQKLSSRFALGLLRGRSESLMITPYRAVHGTDLLPLPVREAVGASTVPLLAGTVQHETAGFVEGLAGVPVLGSLARRGLRHALSLDGAARRAWSTGPRRLTDPLEQIEAAWTEHAFRGPTREAVERRPGPSWLYEFRWRAREPMGAAHGIELPFSGDVLGVVDDLTDDAREHLQGAPQHLADDVHGSFVEFIHGNDPGWPRFDAPHRWTRVWDESGRPGLLGDVPA
ncbi:carboxylesterase/lipase family protein [Litorihabitans aurantiacus]|uniref:Carboxylic ester hydrolase n=1 Tax=Litorihabitans aurantiacus TaxID=1930061 RepID=A0AA37US97_9MICO|nr:carboxylesterase family protein [Litorihabitans aurantiacus]GMA31208.1 carboxylic ester hydrolase [Litorihabitans aurantiacus]